jgi:hypothetical protein
MRSRREETGDGTATLEAGPEGAPKSKQRPYGRGRPRGGPRNALGYGTQPGFPTHVQGVRLNHTIFAREERPAMR